MHTLLLLQDITEIGIARRSVLFFHPSAKIQIREVVENHSNSFCTHFLLQSVSRIVKPRNAASDNSNFFRQFPSLIYFLLKGVLSKRLIILNLFPEEPASYYNSMITFIDGEPLLLNLSPVTKENFRDVPDYCRSCLYWQSEGDYDAKDVTKERGHKKLGWLLQIQKESEYSGGFVAYHDVDPLGFVQWGHAKFFPKAREYRSGPLSEDAAFLACLYIF